MIEVRGVVRRQGATQVLGGVSFRAVGVPIDSAVRSLVGLAVRRVRAGEVPGRAAMAIERTTARGSSTLRGSAGADGTMLVGSAGSDWHGAVTTPPDAPWSGAAVAWRDPRIVGVSGPAVAEVAVRPAGGEPFRLDLGGGVVAADGRVAAPKAGRARDAVDRLVAARATETVAWERDWAAVLTIELFDPEGDRIAVVEFGERRPDRLRPVRVADRPEVLFLVEDEILGGSWSFDRFAGPEGRGR